MVMPFYMPEIMITDGAASSLIYRRLPLYFMILSILMASTFRFEPLDRRYRVSYTRTSRSKDGFARKCRQAARRTIAVVYYITI